MPPLPVRPNPQMDRLKNGGLLPVIFLRLSKAGPRDIKLRMSDKKGPVRLYSIAAFFNGGVVTNRWPAGAGWISFNAKFENEI